MSIESVARRVYDRTRDFFKYTAVAKSTNKRYAADATVSREKILRREQGRRAARMNLKHARRERIGKNLFEYGEWLRSAGANAAGNCHEMCCLALFNFTVVPLGNTLSFPVTYVAVTDLADHSFLIAGYLPPAVVDMPCFETSNVTVQMLCNAVPAHAESYVLDPWAGIFCHTRQYPFELLRKMHRWNAQGKEVRWDRAWRRPNDANYLASLVNSRFFIWDRY